MRALRRVSAVFSTAALAAASLVIVGTASPAGAVDVGSQAAFRAAWDTASRIELTENITLTCAGGGHADRDGSAAVEVFGEGHTIRMENGCIDRVLHVRSDSSVTLDHVTIRGGRLPTGGNYGGGILIGGNGNLKIVDSYFTDNVVCDDGAAIDMEGGTSVNPDRELEIVDSTIADNTAYHRGGVAWAGGTPATIVNSTLNDNDAAVDAALYSAAPLELQYADVVDNETHPGVPCPIVGPLAAAHAAEQGDAHADAHASDVDAAVVPPGEVQLEISELDAFGSVLTSETANCQPEVLLHTDSNGYNRASDSTCRLDGKEDEQHVDDPGLDDLADNGGPTKTLLPEKDSQLLDEIPIDKCSGPDDAVDEDQRGVHRPQGDACDIGAVEVEVGGPVVTPVVVEPTFTG